MRRIVLERTIPQLACWWTEAVRQVLTMFSVKVILFSFSRKTGRFILSDSKSTLKLYHSTHWWPVGSCRLSFHENGATHGTGNFSEQPHPSWQSRSSTCAFWFTAGMFPRSRRRHKRFRTFPKLKSWEDCRKLTKEYPWNIDWDLSS